jgi:serine protease Do
MPATAEETFLSAKIKEFDMSEIELLAVIERYLNGEMSPDERIRFDMLRHDNNEVDRQVKEHQIFVGKLKDFGQRVELESRLNAIHSEIDVQAIKEELIDHPLYVVRLWRNHHSKISVAASIAIFAVLSTLFFTGYLSTQDQKSEVIALRRKVDKVIRTNDDFKRSTTAMITNMNNGKKIINPGKYSGTGFALSSDGYIITNEHVIAGADSVYIQNANGDAYRVKTVYTNAAYDIAILKITDTSFKKLAALPYGFKRSHADLGEDVFTIGYPRDDIVYNKGYLSSGTGFNGDTTTYQVSIPVNPGNSGGPVLDGKGNVIGIISGKQTQFDGAAFAVKSRYLYKAIQAIPADSLSSGLNLNNKSSLANLGRSQQIKRIQNYIFMVKVYN